MPQHKSGHSAKEKRQAGAIDQAHEQRGGARPEAGARSWPTAHKLHGKGKAIGSGRKVPNGPVGGSGRKTNLSRSS